MALKHKWLKEARAELERNLEYVRLMFGLSNVRKVLSDVQSHIDMLRKNPNAGIRYKDLSYYGHEVRAFHMKYNSIVYCYDDTTLYVLMFWNNRCDDALVGHILQTR